MRGSLPRRGRALAELGLIRDGALLVHDLNHRPPPGRPLEQLFSDAAAHGGLWTAAYEPRSVLGLAALAGLPATALGRAGPGHSDGSAGAPR